MPEVIKDKKNITTDDSVLDLSKNTDNSQAVAASDYRGPNFLHSFFIPSQHNNYKPHALHSRRLVFYSLSAVAIKILVIIFVLSFPVHAWLTPDILSEQSAKIVAMTNNLRASLNLNPLKSNPVLQEAALAKTEDMLVKQYFAHVSPENKGLKYWLSQRGYNYRVAGENLALGFTEPEAVMQAWQASPTHYANLVDTDFEEIGVAMVGGTYQGYDTTLVAQFFGKVKEMPVEVPSQPEEIITLPSDQILSTTTTATSTPVANVLSERDLEPPSAQKLPVISQPKETMEAILDAPQLLSPADGFLTKSSRLFLQVLAPGADSLSIFVNDKFLLSQNLSSDKVDLNIELSVGNNQVVLESVRGEVKARSAAYSINIDQLPPVIDQERTNIAASQPVGRDDIILKVDAYLSTDTKEAKVVVAKQTINLSIDNLDNSHWTGHLLISDPDEAKLFNPVVLASLAATDLAGNTMTQDIAWSTVPNNQAGLVGQYLFLKKSTLPYLTSLFDISSIYYKIILGLAIMSLLLNIFIEIKKQHPKTIASTMGFIALLVVLIAI